MAITWQYCYHFYIGLDKCHRFYPFVIHKIDNQKQSAVDQQRPNVGKVSWLIVDDIPSLFAYSSPCQGKPFDSQSIRFMILYPDISNMKLKKIVLFSFIHNSQN